MEYPFPYKFGHSQWANGAKMMIGRWCDMHQRHHVTSVFIQCHFYVMCSLDCLPHWYSFSYLQVGALQACFLAKRNYKVDVYEMRQGMYFANHLSLWIFLKSFEASHCAPKIKNLDIVLYYLMFVTCMPCLYVLLCGLKIRNKDSCILYGTWNSKYALISWLKCLVWLGR